MDFGLMLFIFAEGSIMSLPTCMSKEVRAYWFKNKFTRRYNLTNRVLIGNYVKEGSEAESQDQQGEKFLPLSMKTILAMQLLPWVYS
jgi:hypothetical protein